MKINEWFYILSLSEAHALLLSIAIMLTVKCIIEYSFYKIKYRPQHALNLICESSIKCVTTPDSPNAFGKETSPNVDVIPYLWQRLTKMKCLTINNNIHDKQCLPCSRGQHKRKTTFS